MNALLLSIALAAGPTSDALKERLDDGHAIVQLRADAISTLSRDDKEIAWRLTLAAHAGEPIQYDQLGWNLVALKRVLENVYLFGQEGKPGPNGFDARLATYLKKFYGHTGNHDHVTSQKFIPGFTPAQLEAAALRAFKAGAPFGVKDEAALKAQLEQLRPTLFDPAYDPYVTAKSPPPGKDMLTASSNTAYGRDVALKDLEGFAEKNPLNSRVVKVDGKLVEQVFRAGTPDKKVPPGLYAEELNRVIAHAGAAAKLAGPEQKEALTRLIKYFQTGDLADWDAFDIAWLKANPVVDSNLGFIESYADPRGLKGQWEGTINMQDPAETKTMNLLGAKVQYFEDRLPWPDAYKRKNAPAPVAKAIHLITGHPQPPAGQNLPNEQPIREKYGSKSIELTNVMDAIAPLRRLPLSLEVSRDADKEAARKFHVAGRKWLVGFHEVLGHASGQGDPTKVQGDPAKYLKEYTNTLEETRADLVALWHAYDPALAELSPDHEKIAEQMYRDFLGEGLTNLQRVEKGDSFEEDHMRGHHMTVNVFFEKGAAKQVTEKGKTYWVVVDFKKMREAVGELLTQLMTIKATGDYEGIKALVEKKGVKFDPKLRDQIVKRVKALQIPKVPLLVSPRIKPVLDANGALADLAVSDQNLIDQHLERSLLGALPPDDATKVAASLDGSLESLRKAWKDAAAKQPAPAPMPAPGGTLAPQPKKSGP